MNPLDSFLGNDPQCYFKTSPELADGDIGMVLRSFVIFRSNNVDAKFHLNTQILDQRVQIVPIRHRESEQVLVGNCGFHLPRHFRIGHVQLQTLC